MFLLARRRATQLSSVILLNGFSPVRRRRCESSAADGAGMPKERWISDRTAHLSGKEAALLPLPPLEPCLKVSPRKPTTHNLSPLPLKGRSRTVVGSPFDLILRSVRSSPLPPVLCTPASRVSGIAYTAWRYPSTPPAPCADSAPASSPALNAQCGDDSSCGRIQDSAAVGKGYGAVPPVCTTDARSSG